MPEGVIIMVAWRIKPERADEFVLSLKEMFPVTTTYEGFRNIRLVPSNSAGNSDARDFLLIEEWDEVRNFEEYGKFRAGTGDTAMLLEMTASYPQVTIWSTSPLAHAEA